MIAGLRFTLIAVALLLIVACDDGLTPIAPAGPSFSASDTAAVAMPMSASGSASVAVAAQLTYVSMAPGSVPDGAVTEIRSRHSEIRSRTRPTSRRGRQPRSWRRSGW